MIQLMALLIGVWQRWLLGKGHVVYDKGSFLEQPFLSDATITLAVNLDIKRQDLQIPLGILKPSVQYFLNVFRILMKEPGK
jgi:hypothetical protein